MKDISLYIMAGCYIIAGVNHFLNPRFYLQMIPPYLPRHRQMNLLAGIIEVILGLMLLWPMYSKLAAWGIIILLILVFPANVYQLQSAGVNTKIPVWALWLRLPVQGFLVYWAWWHTF